MTSAEKIIVDLIDQRKITGEQALVLIKELKDSIITQPTIPTFPKI